MHSYWDNFFIVRGLKDAASIAGILGKTEGLGAEWLRTLKRVDAIDLEDGPLVLILDAAPADVWVASEETALAALRQAGGEHTTSWSRLDAEPSTPEAVATLRERYLQPSGA